MKQTEFFLSQNEAKYIINLLKKEEWINEGKGSTLAKLETIAAGK